jgi:predicted amidohydrolase
MKFKIATAQYPLTSFEHIVQWQQKCEKWVQDAVNQGADVLVFPEYGSLELASLFPEETRNNPAQLFAEMQPLFATFLRTFQTLVVQYKKIIIAPSFIHRHQNTYCNRVFVFGANGSIDYQDKLFLTRTEREVWGLQDAPQRLTVFSANWGKFGIQMCYDSEFAIGADLLAKEGVELLIVPSCTTSKRGAARVHIGSQARAMEQQIYTAVAQIVGDAPWFPLLAANFGFAAVYASPDLGLPEDGIIKRGEAQQTGWLLTEIDLEVNRIVRQEGQMLNYKDHQEIEMMKTQLIHVVEAGQERFF